MQNYVIIVTSEINTSRCPSWSQFGAPEDKM